MTVPNYILFYVDNPSVSKAFYTPLLEQSPVEDSPTFVLYVLPSGVKFGLWGRHTVEPAFASQMGGCELGFQVEDRNAVQALYAEWGKRGLRIAQAPCEMDFGYTFVALDPDGHRLRVLALEMP